MDAEMYGMMPRAKMVALANEPPANKSSKPNMEFDDKAALIIDPSTPGVGICPPIR